MTGDQNKLYRSVLNKIKLLSADLQASLIDEISKMLESDAENYVDGLFSKYLNAAKEVTGVELSSSRDSNTVTLKALLIWGLVSNGLSESIVGDMVGVNHSTVNYYKNRVRNAIENPARDPVLAHAYKQFNNKLNG